MYPVDEQADSWARDNPDFKSLIDQAVWARYKSPMSHVKNEMAICQSRITDPYKPISHDMREYLLKVLRGEIQPPK